MELKNHHNNVTKILLSPKKRKNYVTTFTPTITHKDQFNVSVFLSKYYSIPPVNLES